MATVFSFEHICKPKTLDVVTDPNCPIGECLKPYKSLNYLSGDGLSKVWSGRPHYDPRSLGWQKHHEKMALPRERVPGQMTFESEDDWRAWQKKRDAYDSKLPGGLGYKFATPPEFKLNGHAFSPYNLYRMGRPPLNLNDAQDPLPPRDDSTFPFIQHEPKGFYGCYHNELDVHNNGGFRFSRREPSYPCACKGSAIMY
ncbi:hypothetical protein HELRODRAFT_161794 [Helobdella robusta]|uniref:Uncharacterized protein n=1 Tax=Helobdella robusta TaxID=6412 RepID=T1ERX4_HELRO|nr:hypothetical protein HELRODRAFT_161794 [Helobdella robusta]ESO02516.1 hypothetical protein HELRODRAFT_161794 [Helobdella robusta]